MHVAGISLARGSRLQWIWGCCGAAPVQVLKGCRLLESYERVYIGLIIRRSNLSSLLGVPVRELAAARSSRSWTHRYLSFPVV